MYWFIFCKDDIILSKDGNIPFATECPIKIDTWNTIHNLPPLRGKRCVTVAIDHPIIDESLIQRSLRSCFDILPFDHYEMAGKAREILYWDANSKFCGACGGPMKKDSDISKKCTCCGKQIWPSLATAIIVLVRKKVMKCTPEGQEEHAFDHEEILMVRAHNFRGDYYGLVAGFVETGESLEQCLQREVLEETGVKVKNIRYFASQPWPYPSGLMVGFMADYAGGDIVLQKSELAAGGWFDRNNLPNIPGKVSLARQLIDKWLEETKN